MRHRITIYSVDSSAQDAAGQPADVETELAAQWASIEPLTGRESWLLPQAVLDRMKPRSMSGGAGGDDGLLYATGHDHTELYALRVPATGERLELVATLPIPFEGQAIAWDPKDKRLLWGISRKDRKAIAVRIPAVK